MENLTYIKNSEAKKGDEMCTFQYQLRGEHLTPCLQLSESFPSFLEYTGDLHLHHHNLSFRLGVLRKFLMRSPMGSPSPSGGTSALFFLLLLLFSRAPHPSHATNSLS